MKTIQISIAALFLGAVYLFGSQAMAFDTDVYLKSQSLQRDDTPNVLIILDTSGSMNTPVTSAPPYDPSVDYCNDDLNSLYPAQIDPNSGKPTTCATAGRIYWAQGTSVPATTSSDWFTDASNVRNKCFHSYTSLSNSAGSNGFFTSEIAYWKSGPGWQQLQSGLVPESEITYLDCSADDTRFSTPDGLTLNDGMYPLGNGNGGTTTAYTSNRRLNFRYTNSMRATLYTANYLNYWNNAQLRQDITRMDVAKEAAKAVIDANTEIRFGLMIFNKNNGTPEINGGRLLFKMDTMDDTRRAQLKSVIDTVQPDGNTPLAETMWEAYNVFSGSAVDYGDDNPVSSVTSMTLSGTTVSVTTSSSHGFKTGDYVMVSGANETDYDGAFVVNVIDSTHFEYTITGTPTSPATGAINATLYRDLSAENSGKYISPFAFACQKAFVIYITDGDPTNDTDADSKIEAKIGTTCSSPSCLDDLAAWMYNNDVYDGLPDAQTVSTYTIGFGGSISASGKALLQETAQDSGGQYKDAQDAASLVSALQSVFAQILEKTTSFTSPSLSVNAFNRLFNREDIYLALFHPSNSVRWEGNIKKYKICTSTDIQNGVNCAIGDLLDAHNPRLKATDINNQILDTAKSDWSSTEDGPDVNKGGAGENIPIASSRTVWTYTGSYSGLSASSPGMPVSLEINSTGNAFYSAVTADPTLLGLPSSATTSDVDQLINWIRGQDAYDQLRDGAGDPVGTHTGNTTEPRDWRLADVVHSRPVAITYGGTNTDPIIKLFYGTNDGMIHMIRNDTGQEQWAFMPQEKYDIQYKLSQGADGDHPWGLDNSPTFWIIDRNRDSIIDPAAGDRVYMFVTERRGGRDIYGFDVTPASVMSTNSDTVTPKLMWVIQGGTGSFTKLAQTWSRPLVERVKVKCVSAGCDDGDPSTPDTDTRIVLLFAGGYDTNQDLAIPAGPDASGTAIYMVDPLTGQRLWWASNDSTADLVLPRMTFSIPSDVAVVDSNGDNAIDRIYVGDTGGQLWRVDLTDQVDPTAGTAAGRDGGSSGYVFADAGCGKGSKPDSVTRDSTTNDCPNNTTEQHRRKFFYPPEIAPVQDPTYSSTPNYDAVVIGSGDREDPLDFLTSALTNPSSKEAVHNRIYVFRDYNYVPGAPTTAPAALTVNDLYDATANLLGTLTGTALDTEISAIQAKDGWFIELQEASAVLVPNGLTTIHVGEKVLAKPTVLDGVAFVTTFTPANDTNSTTTCKAQEGVAKEYALNLFNAAGAADFNKDGTADERVEQVGGGIPSEVVPIYLPDGTTGLVQTSNTPVNASLPQNKGLTRSSWKECTSVPDAAAGGLCGD